MSIETGKHTSFKLHVLAEIRRKCSPICLVVNIIGLTTVLPKHMSTGMSLEIVCSHTDRESGSTSGCYIGLVSGHQAITHNDICDMIKVDESSIRSPMVTFTCDKVSNAFQTCS